MNKKRNGNRIPVLMIIGILLLLAAVGTYGYKFVTGMMAAGEADKVIEKMAQIVPQYEDGDAEATGQGEDPLPVVEISGCDFVGYLELPPSEGSSDVRKIPVASAEHDGSKFAFRESGSPVKGKFKIGGRDQKSALGALDEIKPGDKITFVDMNGIRYPYMVSGMGSVKKWDGVDHDLILYTGISRNVMFAVFGEAE